jgi:hypothetical protein
VILLWVKCGGVAFTYGMKCRQGLKEGDAEALCTASNFSSSSTSTSTTSDEKFVIDTAIVAMVVDPEHFSFLPKRGSLQLIFRPVSVTCVATCDWLLMGAVTLLTCGGLFSGRHLIGTVCAKVRDRLWHSFSEELRWDQVSGNSMTNEDPTYCTRAAPTFHDCKANVHSFIHSCLFAVNCTHTLLHTRDIDSILLCNMQVVLPKAGNQHTEWCEVRRAVLFSGRAWNITLYNLSSHIAKSSVHVCTFRLEL